MKIIIPDKVKVGGHFYTVELTKDMAWLENAVGYHKKAILKIILDLCGGTGAWSKPYKDNGYDVRNITLPGYDVRTYKPPENVYGILSAPPCTHFSIARTRAKTPRDLRKGMKTVIACLNIIWECRYKNKLAFWVLEKPTGFLRQFLGKPFFTFQPYEYGDLYSKKTDLWGYFNIPKKIISDIKNSLLKDLIKNDYGHPTNRRKLPKLKQKGNIPIQLRSDTRARSITPSGFAQAFYEANK